MKKKAEMKRENPPCTPYKRKAKGKETIPGFFWNPLSPCARVRTRKDPSRYRLAGLAADELINILRGAAEDRALWAYYCYHHDIPTLLEKAHTLAARERRGLIANALTAFQSWLTRTFGREAT